MVSVTVGTNLYHTLSLSCPGKRSEIRNLRELRHEVRVHGATAVVTGKTHTKGISGGKPFDAQFQFTDTFVKDGGRWRLLAGHVSKLPAEKITRDR